MHRLIVAILAAVDAAIAVAVGAAATLAPLTLVWVFVFGDGADWASLWPTSASIWQFGHLVPLDVTIPADYLAVAGIDADAASFTLSLAPLAFAAFTAIFAARSGVRASQADAWITGVIAGSAVFAGLAAIVALTAANDVAAVELWRAIVLPSLLFAAPALVAAVVTEWREATGGVIARLRDRVETASHGWGLVPGLIARGSAVVVVGLVGLGATITAVALVLRGSDVIALYEAAHLDLLGAIVVTLAQLAYVPTVVVWALAFAAGPGFAVGEGTAVSAAGTQVGVVPGVPLLGIIPEQATPWLLLLALGPVALGAFAGWIARSRLAASSSRVEPARGRPSSFGIDVPLEQASAPADSDGDEPPMDAATDEARTADLTGLLTAASENPAHDAADDASSVSDPIGARLVALLGIAVLAAAAAALLALMASGSIGPGSLSHLGPAPGPVALAVGLEVILGAGILLLSPRPRPRRRKVGPTPATEAGAAATVIAATGPDEAGASAVAPQPAVLVEDATPTEIEAEGESRADALPRVPFTFPTLPRIPSTPEKPDEGGASPPVD